MADGKAETVEIGTPQLRAEVALHGAELVRLRDEAGRDLLWDGDPAYWTGRAKPGREEAFHRLLDDEIVPAMTTLPGVSRVRTLWPQRREDSPPDLACQVVVEFESREDMERMMASEGRRALRPRVLEAASLFDGALSHIDFEVGSPKVASPAAMPV